MPIGMSRRLTTTLPDKVGPPKMTGLGTGAPCHLGWTGAGASSALCGFVDGLHEALVKPPAAHAAEVWKLRHDASPGLGKERRRRGWDEVPRGRNRSHGLPGRRVGQQIGQLHLD